MGFNGQFHSDQWHHDAATIVIRDGIKSRRWGVRVTVYDDPTPANNGEWVLSYGLTNTDLQDNANWFKTADIGQIWGPGVPVVYTFQNGLEELAGIVSLSSSAGSIIQNVILSSHSANPFVIASYIDATENQGALVNVQSTQLTLRYTIDDIGGEYVAFNLDTGAFFVDARLVPSGLEYLADYSSFYNARSLVDKSYSDANVGAQALSAIAQSPTASEDGYAIVWDNGSLEYTLAATNSVTFANGLTETAGVVRLGGALTGNTNVSMGTNNLQFTNVRHSLEFFQGDSLNIKSFATGLGISIIDQSGNGVVVNSTSGTSTQWYLSPNVIDISSATPTFAGIRYATDFSANYNVTSLPDVNYVTTHLGIESLSATAQNPTIAEDGYGIAWNNTNLEYEVVPVLHWTSVDPLAAFTPVNLLLVNISGTDYYIQLGSV